MVDYYYYENSFMGELIPEEKFDKLSKKAEGILKSRVFQDFTNYEKEVKDTICSIAEILYNQELIIIKINEIGQGTSQIVSSEKVGDWSKNYSTTTVNDLKAVSSQEYVDSLINAEIETNLLWTGLLYRGVYVR